MFLLNQPQNVMTAIYKAMRLLLPALRFFFPLRHEIPSRTFMINKHNRPRTQHRPFHQF